MTYRVLVNTEGQHAIVSYKKGIPAGWADVGVRGKKRACQEYVRYIWTDMRPMSLRKEMRDIQRRWKNLEREHEQKLRDHKKKPNDSRDHLIPYLSEGLHQLEPVLNPEKSAKKLQEAVEQGYIQIKFTGTRGYTGLGINLDAEACSITEGDYRKGTGKVHLEGEAQLDFVRLRCIADVDISTLKGTGYIITQDNLKVGQEGIRGAA